MWALHCIQNNYSFASSDDVTSLFAAMFPDSSVPKKMAMGRKSWPTSLQMEFSHMYTHFCAQPYVTFTFRYL
jgi:hypothetical protein